MRGKVQIAFKLVIIVVCLVLFVWLIRKDEKEFQLTQPAGEGIAAEDAVILMDAVSEKETVPLEERQRIKQWTAEIINTYGSGSRQFLSYEDYETLAGYLSREAAFPEKNKYRSDFYLLKSDWYEIFDSILSRYGLEESIRSQEIGILTKKASASGRELSEGRLIDASGTERGYRSGEFEECFFSGAAVYLDGEDLLTVRERKKASLTLDNLWIMEADEESLQFFYQGYEIIYDRKEKDRLQEAEREKIADLTFSEGILRKVNRKEERINGKLLRLAEGELEIEGGGTFPVDDGCRLYQLYEELREAGWEELRIGYDFTDFVIEDGKVCAGLITRKENMESIRVAVKSNGFSSLYHESVHLKADCSAFLIYGPYGDRITKEIREGEEIRIDQGSDYLKGDRIEFVPSVKSGKTQVLSLTRKQGAPAYRGRMEIAGTDQGLLLINELLLEEYLYSVVPSEIPASYSLECQKAQAVCARTYAYRFLSSPGLKEIGAHVDDSVNYQVYNNVTENVNSTKAVKETAGTILYYGNEPVSTYYYSTSCGFGTDAGIWAEQNKEKMPYLMALHIAQGEDGRGKAQELSGEEAFREYILRTGEEDYEKEEAWYRWKYEVEELDAKRIAKRIQERYRADHNKVLFFTEAADEEEGENYEDRPTETFREIYNMEIRKRREGGVADELLIETDAGSYLVRSEYNIRYIMNNGGSIRRQDGIETEAGSLLPSAYFVMDIVKEGGIVIGYSIFGGGYGHGVGMSQNGARAMADTGKNSEEILAFFYPGCELKKIY